VGFARRERQRAKQALHAVKLRGGEGFLYDVATAKSASTETSSVGSSAPPERRRLATELVSVENRLDAEGIPSRVPLTRPVATELVSVENRFDSWAVGCAHRTYVFWCRVASAIRGCDAETHLSNE